MMENISQSEIEDVDGFVTYSMIRDAASVMAAHRILNVGLFTRKTTCTCGHESVDVKSWRRHVARIILSRHTALMARYAKKENWSKEVVPV